MQLLGIGPLELLLIAVMFNEINRSHHPQISPVNKPEEDETSADPSQQEDEK
jgi:hypothetical protein